ncbi:hypothetical protein HK102_011006, partial [Quaeritorhiza haematococci]
LEQRPSANNNNGGGNIKERHQPFRPHHTKQNQHQHANNAYPHHQNVIPNYIQQNSRQPQQQSQSQKPPSGTTNFASQTASATSSATREVARSENDVQQPETKESSDAKAETETADAPDRLTSDAATKGDTSTSDDRRESKGASTTRRLSNAGVSSFHQQRQQLPSNTHIVNPSMLLFNGTAVPEYFYYPLMAPMMGMPYFPATPSGSNNSGRNVPNHHTGQGRREGSEGQQQNHQGMCLLSQAMSMPAKTVKDEEHGLTTEGPNAKGKVTQSGEGEGQRKSSGSAGGGSSSRMDNGRKAQQIERERNPIHNRSNPAEGSSSDSTKAEGMGRASDQKQQRNQWAHSYANGRPAQPYTSGPKAPSSNLGSGESKSAELAFNRRSVQMACASGVTAEKGVLAERGSTAMEKASQSAGARGDSNPPASNAAGATNRLRSPSRTRQDPNGSGSATSPSRKDKRKSNKGIVLWANHSHRLSDARNVGTGATNTSSESNEPENSDRSVARRPSLPSMKGMFVVAGSITEREKERKRGKDRDRTGNNGRWDEKSGGGADNSNNGGRNREGRRRSRSWNSAPGTFTMDTEDWATCSTTSTSSVTSSSSRRNPSVDRQGRSLLDDSGVSNARVPRPMGRGRGIRIPSPPTSPRSRPTPSTIFETAVWPAVPSVQNSENTTDSQPADVNNKSKFTSPAPLLLYSSVLGGQQSAPKPPSSAEVSPTETTATTTTAPTATSSAGATANASHSTARVKTPSPVPPVIFSYKAALERGLQEAQVSSGVNALSQAGSRSAAPKDNSSDGDAAASSPQKTASFGAMSAATVSPTTAEDEGGRDHQQKADSASGAPPPPSRSIPSAAKTAVSSSSGTTDVAAIESSDKMNTISSDAEQ